MSTCIKAAFHIKYVQHLSIANAVLAHPEVTMLPYVCDAVRDKEDPRMNVGPPFVLRRLAHCAWPMIESDVTLVWAVQR